MRHAERPTEPLDFETYQRSQRRLGALRTTLQPEDVQDLAREVIRRLADRGSPQEDAVPGPTPVEALAEALVSPDARASARLVATLREQGVPVEGIYLDHLSGAARLLGQWWDEDRLPFTEVSLAAVRIFALLQQLRCALPIPRSTDRAAIFAAVPGETHTLGVRMAADLFRSDGWTIDLKVGVPHDDLVTEIAESGRGLIGISIGGSHCLAALARLVVALWVSAPRAAVFVGGHVTGETERAVSRLGVDGMASDIGTAREVMARLWARGE